MINIPRKYFLQQANYLHDLLTTKIPKGSSWLQSNLLNNAIKLYKESTHQDTLYINYHDKH